MPISRTPVGRSVLKKSWDSMIDTLLFPFRVAFALALSRSLDTVSAPTLCSLRDEALSIHLRFGLRAFCLRFKSFVT